MKKLEKIVSDIKRDYKDIEEEQIRKILSSLIMRQHLIIKK